MNKSGFLALAAQLAPGIFRVRCGTWLAIAVGLLGVFALLAWGAVSLFGWFWGQAKSLAEIAPEAARGAIGRVEQAVPGAREQLGKFVPALKPEPPPRDVSGTDVGPVARYPGLARSHWHREGREITVRYEGEADFAAVLDHYVKGFAAQGYAQNLLSATSGEEKHEYLKSADRVGFTLTQKPKGGLKVTLVAVLP
ncbi:MAG: hypothetical protein C0522_07235 [Rhodocyclaceae bacterium]|jgi:hypothetical protein|nr:hypothetical protein [Rhodocyclaceae bacterium]